MYKTEQNTPLNAVDVERLPNGKTRIILRINISSEVRSEEGISYTVYTADEVAYVALGEVTPEYVAEHFDDLWFYAENGETKAEKYARLVDAYVREKYSQSAVEAIINNYLSDPENVEYKAEFNALQAYRESCKIRAKSEIG